MNVPISHESKKEFQLERMILFIDAVFAIAITLLIIDLKIPDLLPPVTNEKMSDSVISLIPKFTGFVLSFFIIGLYWTIHHRIFGFIIGYTNKLVWLNLIFLFGVVLMPFSTSFYSEYLLEYLKLPVIFYAINISFLGVMNYRLEICEQSAKPSYRKPSAPFAAILLFPGLGDSGNLHDYARALFVFPNLRPFLTID